MKNKFRDIKFDVFKKIVIGDDKYIIGYVYIYWLLYVKRMSDDKICKVESIKLNGFQEIENYVKTTVETFIFINDTEGN